ncbi:PAS domain S-box-containing protein [Flaviramulus basaltis]|uniref:histidine kinase n=1 Tax=Flaviramulus basaltis TaxID=369401 RepID=A0A1K2IS55_9FLAO|nr:PAS domain S-box protein [Flaviramulus basaltis]SFZ95142.1 PAS domain S-box-containing protein [Flaviramulus basaltis]
MSTTQIEILQRALYRERESRKQAEKILEDKSRELYSTAEQLKKTNEKLKQLVLQKTIELEGFVENLVDAYVLIDTKGNVIKMNDTASKLFGYNLDEETLNVSNIIYKDDYEYAINSFNELLNKGSFTNYTARVYTKWKEVKLVHINSSVIYDDKKRPIAAQGIVRDITDETAIKKLFEEQKHQLNIIFDNSPIGITLSKNHQNGLLLANKSICKMLGYSSEEFNTMQVQDITHPDDEEISRLNREKLFKGEIDSFNLEKRYIKKNGEILWAKTTVTAVHDSNGKTNFQLATIEDITKERIAKEQLIESESRLSALVLSLDSGIVVEDENRKIVFTNTKFCELFKIAQSPDLLVGMDCLEASEKNKVLFKNPDAFIERINSINKNKNTVLADELVMNGGTILERDYIPIKIDNQLKGYLWKFTDVTLKRNYRKNLEAEKHKYSRIIANMNLGLVDIDNDGKILMANQSFAKISGYTEKELIGIKAKEILPVEEDKAVVYQKSEERKKGKSHSYEVRIINKKGEIRYWLVSAAPNYNMNNKIIGSIGVILDITNLKNLEIQKENLLKQLERSNDELHEYAHIVSHDLKSPLRSIFALISWIKEDNEILNPSTLYNIELIESTLEKMEQLISDILNYSSVTSDTIQDKPVDLNIVVKDLCQILFIPEHISIKVLKDLPVVHGDKTRLQQLFQNLLSNAIRYIDKEIGLIKIDVIEKTTHYQFSITDNGIGIKKEYHDKIFKIFHSLNNNKESSGIGLSIVKKIVDLYKGEIWLESIVGEGTTFYFTIKK